MTSQNVCLLSIVRVSLQSFHPSVFMWISNMCIKKVEMLQNSEIQKFSFDCSHLLTIITHLFAIPLITHQYIHQSLATRSLPDCLCATSLIPAPIYIATFFFLPSLKYLDSASAKPVSFVCLDFVSLNIFLVKTLYLIFASWVVYLDSVFFLQLSLKPLHARHTKWWLTKTSDLCGLISLWL